MLHLASGLVNGCLRILILTDGLRQGGRGENDKSFQKFHDFCFFFVLFFVRFFLLEVYLYVSLIRRD